MRRPPIWLALVTLAVLTPVHDAPQRVSQQVSRAGIEPSPLGRAFFVSPRGSDDNPGTAERPFLTIQHAADVVSPGDSVTVADGVYGGTAAGTRCGGGSRPIVCITRGGTPDAPVTFLAQHPLGARLDGADNMNTDGIRAMSGVTDIRIRGFEIFGVGNASGSASGIELFAGGARAEITGNDIHDVGRLCTETSNGQVGIFVQQPDVAITANRIHDIGRFINGENGCRTTYAGSRDHAIYVNGNTSGSSRGANDIFIANNLFYSNARGWGVQLYPGTLARIRIVNNTFAFANPSQDGQIIIGANTVDGRIGNNIFYAPRKAAISYYTGTQINLQVTNNVVYSAALFTTPPPGVTTAANMEADPLFVRTSPPYDFHLRRGSPAIGAGLAEGRVAVDFDGRARSRVNDIGAFGFDR